MLRARRGVHLLIRIMVGGCGFEVKMDRGFISTFVRSAC
jgi:hypothetical protein